MAQQALTRYLGGLPVVFHHGAFQFVVEVLYTFAVPPRPRDLRSVRYRLQVLFF